ncbi:shikimate dehydrogenase [Rathayibacter sp. VKM Ac-2857]|uniref:shikimate dehydrogenase family protein n=1 Tax=Rathayibacter sp. VKM Ac-2857 TaxID=2739020 RepID=UPI001563E5A9|nr:shikimate dehydrogenase [Rathayibacter sp. VKM Ac-2857]NQX18308.1 shikimate dehydrogenase [Rathayibacter sp. VKM Ac-2857]
MISGRTTLIAHLGYPTDTFTSPSICNPWFERNGFDAAVIPMSAKAVGYPDLFRSLFTLTNLRGALVTMPHKVTTMDLVDEVSPAAAIAGATNAVVRREDGSLLADQFDGAGFVRALVKKGFVPHGTRVMIIGTGGVGSAIAASLAGARVGEIGLVNRSSASAEALAQRLRHYYPEVATGLGSRDPRGYELIVNATSLGLRAGDPLPVDLDGVDSGTYVADAVNTTALTPFLAAALERGCTIQVGADMLYEMVPAYLAFFGFEGATAEELR